MRFTLTVDSGNEAFDTEEKARDQLCRIMFDVHAKLCDETVTDGTIRDINGNTVGNWCLTMEDV